MGRSYPHLSLEERRRIDKWRDAKMPVPEIADRLGRAPRNTYVDTELPELNGYYCMTAKAKYEQRRAIHRKMIVHPELKTAIEDRLKAGCSPEQIAGRMRLERHAIRVRNETIYRFAYSKDGREEQFYRHLPEHRRRRRPRGHRRHNRTHIFDVQSLSHKPDRISERTEFGHCECDLMMFRKEHGKVNLTSLVERVSRYAVVLRNEDRQSKTVMEALIQGLAPRRAETRQSITFDRGFELRASRKFKSGIGTDSWFCDLHGPWQKGSVENLNKRARRYLPRDTRFAALSASASAGEPPRKPLGKR